LQRREKRIARKGKGKKRDSRKGRRQGRRDVVFSRSSRSTEDVISELMTYEKEERKSGGMKVKGRGKKDRRVGG